MIRSRCKVWLRSLLWTSSQHLHRGLVATLQGMGAVNVASSWVLGWITLLVVFLAFCLTKFCRSVWVVLVHGQCYDVRLAILDGTVVVADPTPMAPNTPSEPAFVPSALTPPQSQSPEKSVSSSSGDSSFTKVSAIRVSDESEAGSDYSVLFAE